MISNDIYVCLSVSRWV